MIQIRYTLNLFKMKMFEFNKRWKTITTQSYTNQNNFSNTVHQIQGN